MNLADLPPNAFDVHIKAGYVVHFKERLTVVAATRYECLQKIRALGNGRLETQPALIGAEWRATFVQAVNFESESRKSSKPNSD